VITKLNLAGKPFNNRALPWAVTSVVVFLSFAALIFMAQATGRSNWAAYSVQSDINGLNQEKNVLQKQAQIVKNSLTAEQLQTLNAAHELVDRKQFSWSRLFADLEPALPGSVRVTRISVRDAAARGEQTLAELDLTVVAKTPTTVTDMIADMDRAGVFRAELRSQNLQKGRGETGTEYELYVLYRPRAGAALSDSQAANLVSAESSASASKGGVR
jgi:Tfp pilus assembly protein PilN